jgi:hypothetical protein
MQLLLQQSADVAQSFPTAPQLDAHASDVMPVQYGSVSQQPLSHGCPAQLAPHATSQVGMTQSTKAR